MALTPEQIRQKLLEQVARLPAEQQAALKEQIMSATTEQLEAYSKPAQEGEGGGCLFCGIAQGKVKTTKVFEDENVVAFLDITPNTPGQVIIAPKEHIQFIFELSDQVLWNIAKLIKMLTPFIINETKAKGLSTYFAQGPAAGQMMEHLSINLIPRFEDDKAVFAWERKQADPAELEKVAKKISSEIEKSLRQEREKIEQQMRAKMEAERPKSPEELPQSPERKA